MDFPAAGRPVPAPATPGEPPSIVELIRRGTLDAELAALVWVLVEGRIPLVVASPGGLVDREIAADVLRGLMASLRPDLGLAGLDALEIDRPLGLLSARKVVRGELPAGVARAGSLLELRRELAATPPLGLSEDELSFLGCVLVLGEDAAPEVAAAHPAGEPPRSVRVAAAHYVRPLHRDAHGHAQLLDPAVLATWDPRTRAFEHFAWGVIPEIAARLGHRVADLEADLHHRRDDLGGLVAAGVTAIDEVARLVTGYRVGYGQPHESGAPH